MTKEQLKEKYSDRAVVTRLTKNYSMVTYPHSYYMELVDIILKRK